MGQMQKILEDQGPGKIWEEEVEVADGGAGRTSERISSPLIFKSDSFLKPDFKGHEF